MYSHFTPDRKKQFINFLCSIITNYILHSKLVESRNVLDKLLRLTKVRSCISYCCLSHPYTRQRPPLDFHAVRLCANDDQLDDDAHIYDTKFKFP